MVADTPNKYAGLIADFRQECGSVSKKLSEFINGLTPPGRIYHYTNKEGFAGILRSGSLRMTDIFSLNDPSELRFGFEEGKKSISEAAKKFGIRDVHLVSNVVSHVDDHLENLAHHFICSFSQTTTDIGQWRLYAADGLGFALGFETNSLEEGLMACTPEQCASGTFPVTYGPIELAKFNDDLCSRLRPLFKRAESGGMGEDEQIMLVNAGFILSEQFIAHALHFKHGGYEREKEYRFYRGFPVDYKEIPIQTTLHGDKSRRHIDYHWRCQAPQALKEIIIGPAADEELARAFVQGILASANFDSAELSIYKIDLPYRRVSTDAEAPLTPPPAPLTPSRDNLKSSPKAGA